MKKVSSQQWAGLESDEQDLNAMLTVTMPSYWNISFLSQSLPDKTCFSTYDKSRQGSSARFCIASDQIWHTHTCRRTQTEGHISQRSTPLQLVAQHITSRTGEKKHFLFKRCSVFKKILLLAGQPLRYKLQTSVSGVCCQMTKEQSCSQRLCKHFSGS